MKYLTKEWYETMQKTDLHILLRVYEKAEKFSEEHFRKLYKQEEKKWLSLQEETHKVEFEDVFPEEFSFIPVSIDGKPIDPSEFEKAREKYYEMREEARLQFENPFDPEEEKKNFRRFFRNKVKQLKRSLPNEILEEVADIRVLALNRASAAVKKKITAYCRSNKKAVENALKAYSKEHRKKFRDKEPEFIDKFRFHDSKVISCRKKRNDILIKIESGGFTDISQITFKNCSVLKQDAPLHGAWWLYDEIYKSGDRYEIHVLLTKNELIDFIVYATDVEFQ